MAEEQTIAPAAQAAEGPVTRETLLAELKQLSDEAPEAETTGEQQPAKPAAEPEPEANAEEESAEESDEDTEAEAEDESPADPKTAKGIEAIKRQHKREKEKLDRDRREMELERERIVAEWKPKV